MSQQQSTAPLVSYHGGHSLTDGEGEPERFVEAAIEKQIAPNMKNMAVSIRRYAESKKG